MLLTPDQIERLRQIIRDASTAVAVSTTGLEVSPDELQRLADEGYVDASNLRDITLDAFEFGRLMTRLSEARDMTYPQFVRHLEVNAVPLTDAEQRAMNLARTRAGQYCVGLGNRYAGEASLLTLQQDQLLAERQRRGIEDATAERLERRESIGELRSALGGIADDWARDWGRIAATESHLAHQQGLIESYVDQFGEAELIAKVPEPTACDACKAAYLDSNGRPKVKPASWWLANGVSNAGRKRADWKAVLGGMHSWCQCQLVRVPRGMAFNDAWELVPEDEVEDLAKARKLHYRTTFAGLPISIENRKGSYRRWYDASAQREGKTFMRCPYGYIRLTEGVDGDHVDCFLGPNEDAPKVYVVRAQKPPDFKRYDEDKVMLGFDSKADAVAAFKAHYDDPRFFGEVDTFDVDAFMTKISDKSKRGEMIKSEKQLSLFGGKPAAAGEVRQWRSVAHQKQADGTWRRVKTARADRIEHGMEKIASITRVYVNASGGTEKRVFSDPASNLAGKNVGIQIVAAEVPKTPRGLERYRKAGSAGLRVMIDSGEFGRFGKQVRGKDPPPLDFDAVIDAYERVAGVMPPGTLAVVAPDRIADPQMTAELRARYAHRMRDLQRQGVEVIVPIQARTTREIETDYMRAAELFGDDIVLAFPTAAETLPMGQIVPALATLYASGRSNRVHFLGGAAPHNMADRMIQVVATAYFSARGLPRDQVLQLVSSPERAVEALRKLKTQDDVNSAPPSELDERVRAWAGGDDYDETEHWLDFFEDHPEEFDLELRDESDKEKMFRDLAGLVQFDTRVVSALQQYEKQHALSGGQVRADAELQAMPKVERHLPTLERYLAAREYQGELRLPERDSGFWSMFKSRTFPGKAGFHGVGLRIGEVRTMGNYGDPADADDSWRAKPQKDHPGSPESRARREKRKRDPDGKPAKKKKRLVEGGESLRHVKGQAKGKDVDDDDDDDELDIDRGADRNRQRLQQRSERRAEAGRNIKGIPKLTIRGRL